MPCITIDGNVLEYDPAKHKRLLQFALDTGVEIPYFCYHPAMSSPTNCRMCLVDVGLTQKDRATGEILREENGEPKIMWGRKPATACNQDLVPDMVVRTHRSSAPIKKAQEGVLEFMLSNHPLDCPICDQAGECPLQIQTYKYGPEGSRFEVDKVHKPKRIQLGPRVSLDAERCINCTRCVRFAEEISGSEQLMIINRGEKNYPAAAPGRTFDDPYSMNTIDLCPVGALTSTHFRFKARAWEMNYTPGVCTGCSTGCSIDVWVRDNEVLRLTPRHNPDVNQYWMCDEGRLDIERLNKGRVQGAKVKGDIPIGWEEALSHAQTLLNQHKGRTVFVGSAYSSLENLVAFKALAEQMGAAEVVFLKHDVPGRGDNFLRRDDVTPNRKGAEWVGMQGIAPSQLPAQLKNAALVVVMEDATAQGIIHGNFDGPVVAFAHQYAKGYEKAELLMGTANEVEQPSIFVNDKEIPQMTQQARQIRNMTPEDWMGMSKSRLDGAGQLTDRWRHAEHILDVFPTWKLVGRLRELLGGTVAHEANHKAYFQHLKQQFPALEVIPYNKKFRKNTFKHSQFEFAIDINARVHKV